MATKLKQLCFYFNFLANISFGYAKFSSKQVICSRQNCIFTFSTTCLKKTVWEKAKKKRKRKMTKIVGIGGSDTTVDVVGATTQHVCVIELHM